MIGTVYHYFKKYVRPERRRVLMSIQPWLAIFLALVIVIHPGISERFLAFEAIQILVNYNFMAFGFTIAALTIVFAVPNSKFIEFMFEASERRPDLGAGPWEDALFVMSWNGFAHFIALIASLLTLAISYNFKVDHAPLVYDVSVISSKSIYGLFWAVQIYALMQFLETLLSTYLFCSTYIRSLRAEWKKTRSIGTESGNAAPSAAAPAQPRGLFRRVLDTFNR